MRYSKPQLHSLTKDTSTGKCADGSSADTGGTCEAGGNIADIGCTVGSAALAFCNAGDAASVCVTGGGTTTGCSVGNSATGAPPCVAGLFFT